MLCISQIWIYMYINVRVSVLEKLCVFLDKLNKISHVPDAVARLLLGLEKRCKSKICSKFCLL